MPTLNAIYLNETFVATTHSPSFMLQASKNHDPTICLCVEQLLVLIFVF